MARLKNLVLILWVYIFYNVILGMYINLWSIVLSLKIPGCIHWNANIKIHIHKSWIFVPKIWTIYKGPAPPAVNKNVFTSQQNSELKAAQLFCILSKFSYKTYSHMKVTESLFVNENFARPRQHVVKGSLRLNLMFDGELVLNLSAKIYKNRAPADVAFSSWIY